MLTFAPAVRVLASSETVTDRPAFNWSVIAILKMFDLLVVSTGRACGFAYELVFKHCIHI